VIPSLAPRWTFRLFDGAGRCLYVGMCATFPANRIASLKARYEWAKATKRYELEEHATAAKAGFVYRELIRVDPPLHGRVPRYEAVAA
jgi:hypothetical protein